MRPIATGVGSNLRRDFRPQCSRDLTVRLAPSDASETSAFLRAAHSQKWMKWSNLNMLKNPQKHWDFAKCAGLRMVISLSAMRARAWKTTKIPSATLRTRPFHQPSAAHGSSLVRWPEQVANFQVLSDALRRASVSWCSPISKLLTLYGRQRLRVSQPSHRARMQRPADRRSRQWSNGGPTVRLPKWHSVASCDEIASPQRMGPPQKFSPTLGRGNSRATRHSLFF